MFTISSTSISSVCVSTERERENADIDQFVDRFLHCTFLDMYVCVYTHTYVNMCIYIYIYRER